MNFDMMEDTQDRRCQVPFGKACPDLLSDTRVHELAWELQRTRGGVEGNAGVESAGALTESQPAVEAIGAGSMPHEQVELTFNRALPPIEWVPTRLPPITPLPEVFESNSEAVWALFDSAQRAQDQQENAA